MWIIWPQNFEAPQLLASRMLTMHNKCWRKALSLSPIQPPRLDSKSPTNPPWFNEPLPLLYEIYRYLYTECTAVWWAQFPPKKQRYCSCPIYLVNNYPIIFFKRKYPPSSSKGYILDHFNRISFKVKSWNSIRFTMINCGQIRVLEAGLNKERNWVLATASLRHASLTPIWLSHFSGLLKMSGHDCLIAGTSWSHMTVVVVPVVVHDYI